MKNRFGLIIMIILLFALSKGVLGGVEPIRLLMGSEDFVKNHWATNTFFFDIWFGQRQLSPAFVSGITMYLDPKPTNYSDLFNRIQLNVRALIKHGMTNPLIDPSKPFVIDMGTRENLDFQDTFQPFETFWEGFALSGDFPVLLNRHPVIARIPGIKWAKIVVTDLKGEVIDGFDGFLDPNTYEKLIFPDGNYLRMDREYVTFEGKPIRVEVYLSENGRYHSFVNGVEQPWKQPRLGITPSSEGMQITVTGDPNQTFNLEVSDDLKAWESVSVGFIPYRNSWKWMDTSLLPSRFYRLVHR